MLTELTECTVLMLKILCDMYSKHRITYDDFVDYTATKIKFLNENIDAIPSESGRKDANEVLARCKSLLQENAEQYLQM